MKTSEQKQCSFRNGRDSPRARIPVHLWITACPQSGCKTQSLVLPRLAWHQHLRAKPTPEQTVSGETATVVEVDADAMALNKTEKSAMHPWWSSQPKKHGKGKGKACHSEGSSEQSLSIAHTMGPRKEGPTRAAYLGLTPGARSILGSKGILRNRCT